MSLMKSEYLCTKRALKTAEENIEELEKAMEHRIKKVEIELQQKTQLIESMFKNNVFKWYAILEEKLSHKIPATLKMSEYSKRDNWYSASIVWKYGGFLNPIFTVYPKIQLRVVTAGCGNGTLSVQLYLVKGGCSAGLLFTSIHIHILKAEIKMIPFDVIILNQISDSEHYLIQSNKILTLIASLQVKIAEY